MRNMPHLTFLDLDRLLCKERYGHHIDKIVHDVYKERFRFSNIKGEGKQVHVILQELLREYKTIRPSCWANGVVDFTLAADILESKVAWDQAKGSK